MKKQNKILLAVLAVVVVAGVAFYAGNSELLQGKLYKIPKAPIVSLSFSERCQTYGFYGLDDWFHVQLQDMTGKVSNSCVADDWSVTMASGSTNVFGEVVKYAQEVRIKRADGGSMNVRAIQMTDDNYIMFEKANSAKR